MIPSNPKLHPKHPEFDLQELRKTLALATTSDQPQEGVEFASPIPGFVVVAVEVWEKGGEGDLFGITHDGASTVAFGAAAAHVSEDGKTVNVPRNSMMLPLRVGDTFLFLASANKKDVRFHARFIPYE